MPRSRDIAPVDLLRSARDDRLVGMTAALLTRSVALSRRSRTMTAMLYRFRCPLCHTPIETTKTVEIHETHAHRTLVHVRIRGGRRLIHECGAASP